MAYTISISNNKENNNPLKPGDIGIIRDYSTEFDNRIVLKLYDGFYQEIGNDSYFSDAIDDSVVPLHDNDVVTIAFTSE